MRRPCITSLFPTQAWALFEIGKERGLLGPIGVGHGKTLLGVLAPLALGVRLALLLVPANLRNQLREEYNLIRQHWRVPSLVIHKVNYVARADPDCTLHVMSYSALSQQNATAFLESLKPQAIILDEAHKVANADSTRTMRLERYLRANPDTRVCAWTGSMTDNSVTNYSVLSAWALREKSPLPIDQQVAQEWGGALDAGEERAAPGALEVLCEPGEEIRDAFHRRLVSTSGVVTTQSPAASAELVIHERPAPAIPDSVSAALADLRGNWARPDGEEFTTALDVQRCARELGVGFYYKWVYPNGEPKPLHDRWFKARKAWNRAVRARLFRAEPHMDSPALLQAAAQRHFDGRDDDGPTWNEPSWPAWRDVRALVQPETEAVRLDPFLAQDAATWALENRGIVWYDSHEFGLWVAELSGLPQYGGGAEGAEISRESGERSVIASIKAHGTGRNGLQYLFNRQLVAQAPGRASTWEQLLGRLHRSGQEREKVVTEVYRHTEEYEAAVDRALDRALYVEQTIGSRQKLRQGWK